MGDVITTAAAHLRERLLAKLDLVLKLRRVCRNVLSVVNCPLRYPFQFGLVDCILPMHTRLASVCLIFSRTCSPRCFINCRTKLSRSTRARGNRLYGTNEGGSRPKSAFRHPYTKHLHSHESPQSSHFAQTTVLSPEHIRTNSCHEDPARTCQYLTYMTRTQHAMPNRHTAPSHVVTYVPCPRAHSTV